VYNITYINANGEHVATEAQEPTEMREACDKLARDGFTHIRVWMLVHTVEVETKVAWTDHARGITGGV
jgi:hypothetical protein